MEVLFLVVALGLMALIAMSQCAHHSSRRHEKLYPATFHRKGDTAPILPAVPERMPDAAVVADRESMPTAGGRR